jgi:hypothetical protein
VAVRRSSAAVALRLGGMTPGGSGVGVSRSRRQRSSRQSRSQAASGTSVRRRYATPASRRRRTPRRSPGRKLQAMRRAMTSSAAQTTAQGHRDASRTKATSGEGSGDRSAAAPSRHVTPDGKPIKAATARRHVVPAPTRTPVRRRSRRAPHEDGPRRPPEDPVPRQARILAARCPRPPGHRVLRLAERNGEAQRRMTVAS